MVDQTSPYLDGWHSHKDGIASERNPFNEETQSFSYSQWQSGWCERFGRQKHNLDMKEEYDFEFGY